MDTITWGIAGTGRIAATVAEDLMLLPDARLGAVGSRDAARGQAFADRFGSGRGLTYAQLMDSDVDVIYIATPHPQHHALAMAALRAGKAVLVEKAFTATLAGTQEVVALARETGVFCMEGMWTRFQPAVAKVRELVAAGVLGEVRRVEADLGAYRAFDPNDRLFAPELGGGSMLDLGVYPISFAQHFLGTAEQIHVVGSLFDNGVDRDFSAALGYGEGRSAAVAGGLSAESAGRAVVAGTDAWVEVEPRFHHPTAIVVNRRGTGPERFELPATGSGYFHELAHVQECLRAGRSESEIMPLADTVEVMRVLEEGCRQLGVAYAEDTTLQV